MFEELEFKLKRPITWMGRKIKIKIEREIEIEIEFERRDNQKITEICWKVRSSNDSLK